LVVVLAVTTQGQAEDYYIYHDPDGKLVISNKKPTPGSKIIRQRNLRVCKGAPKSTGETPSKQTDRK